MTTICTSDTVTGDNGNAKGRKKNKLDNDVKFNFLMEENEA